MSIIGWIVLGLMAGVVANIIYPNPSRGGLLGALILGVLGSLVGGFLSSVFLGISVTGINATSFVIAILGSLLLLYVGGSFRRVSM